MQSGSESKKDINLRFGTRVKQFRGQMGISQEALAERAGLDRTYIGHVERGARNVSLSTIDKLARALEVSTAALLAQPEERKPETESLDRLNLAGCVDILLVEDNRHDAELTLRAFKRAEFSNRVHLVKDGAEALEFLFRTGRHAQRASDPRPGLILLDLNLPKLGGIEVLRRIKKDPRTRRIPVVVLTVNRTQEVIAEALRLGAAAYIVKPVDFQRFLEVTPQLPFRWALLEPEQTRTYERSARN